MSQANQEKLFEIKKVGKYWLIGKPGEKLKRHLSLTNFKDVELSDNFLIADDVIFEIQKDERSEVVLVEIEDVPAYEKGQNICYSKQRSKTNDNALNKNGSFTKDVAKTFTRDSDAQTQTTHINTDEILKDVYGELEMGQTEDDCQSFEAWQTEDDYQLLEAGQKRIDSQSFEAGHTEDDYQSFGAGHTEDDYQSFEAGHTEDDYQSFEAGQTEDDHQSFEAGHTEDDYQSFVSGRTEDRRFIKTTYVHDLATTSQGSKKHGTGSKSSHGVVSDSWQNSIRTDKEFHMITHFKNSSLRKTEIKFPRAPGYPVELVQMCCQKTFDDLKNYECVVSFSEDEIYVKGPEGMTYIAKARIDMAIEDMKKEYPSQETLDVGQSGLDSSYVRKYFEEIKKRLNVNCIMSNMKNVQFFGKKIQDVAKAKDWLANLTSHNKIDLDSSKGMQESAVRPKQRGIGRQFSWSTSTRGLQLFETKEKIVIKVYSADILTAPVDCIVNAANVNLQHGGGIAKAIAQAAGKDLVKEGHDFLKKHGKLRVGEACYTGAGKMPFDCVIHAVGPCWSDYHPHTMRDLEKCETDLYNAVINSLKTAEARKLKMIAVSSISSGIYGCPLDLCSVQYAKAVLDYSALSHSPLKEIHFVDTNMEMVKTLQETFHSMIPGDKVPKSYNKLKYVNFEGASNNSDKGRRTPQNKRTDEPHLSMKANDKPEKWNKSGRAASSKSGMVIYPFCLSDVPPGLKTKEFACCFGEGQNLSIYTGDILAVKNIDMVVCGIIPGGKTEGKLSKAISEKGGVPYENDKKEAFKKRVNPGDVVLCKSGKLNKITWIGHAILYSRDVDDDMMHRLFLNIFSTLEDKQCHSLAIPLTGTGTGKRDPVYCAERLIYALMDFCSFQKSFWFRIHLINIEEDKTQTAVEVAKRFVRDSRQRPVATSH